MHARSRFFQTGRHTLNNASEGTDLSPTLLNVRVQILIPHISQHVTTFDTTLEFVIIRYSNSETFSNINGLFRQTCSGNMGFPKSDISEYNYV